MRRCRYIGFLMMTVMLLVGGMTSEVWAAKVTYHILTLPIDSVNRYNYHMKPAVHGYRLEAVTVVADNQSTVELPGYYKSPLAENFYYFKPEDVTKVDNSGINLYDYGPNKGIRYQVNADADTITEGKTITAQTAEYYVTYTYKNDPAIAKLDGSVRYNIQVRNKGFLSLNRGRNNRPAIIPITSPSGSIQVTPEILASEDFSYIENPHKDITTYYQSGDENKNDKALTGSKFFFGFKFEGEDPYHIVIRTSYAKDTTYIEKNDGTNPLQIVYKWYKEASLFAIGTNKAYIASDEHIRYSTAWVQGNPNTVTPGSEPRRGNYHGQTSAAWNTFALLNNNDNNGYVFMGTRTVDGSGKVPAPKDDTKYYYLKLDKLNDLFFGQITAEEATKNHTIERFYPLKKVTFKVATPFYKAEATTDHIISVTDEVSQYTVENDPIETKYLPASLNRKYIDFTGKFYSDPACTNEITHFSQATEHPTEGYQVYVGYELTSDIPFKAITPAGSYNATTWANATWYELTDEGSTQTEGLKLKWDGSKFQNNGADGVYDKTSEFAFIGDPFELRVVYRNTTSGGTVQYVGATGTPPATGTSLSLSTTASEGYKWEIPYETPSDSFLLRKYQGSGNWYWDAGHPSPVTVSYSTKAHTYNVATANAQTLTFNVTNLGVPDGDYIKVTADGDYPGQVTVTSEGIHVQEDGTASFTATIKAQGGSDKSFTLSILKYSKSNTPDVGGASVVTVYQNEEAYTANTVQYSTANSTHIKVMGLPARAFTYKIVDKAGNIAAKATVNQTIFSSLSVASIPSVILSPLIVKEDITFFSSYGGSGRGSLSSSITELPAGSAVSSTDVFVKYTTTRLPSMPVPLSEDQEYNVKLNGQYVYYDKDADTLKTNANPTIDDLADSCYLWKLRNRDPYAMLVENLGAREDKGVANQSENPTIYDDDGGTTTRSRQKGAWIKIAGGLPTASYGTALTFDTDRSHAQRFITKSSGTGGVYEVMVATDAVDASTTYYNIGSPVADSVKIYNNSTYAHTNDVLKFILNQNESYIYHLIDKSKHQLLTVESKNPDLVLPAEFISPLVSEYKYYAKNNIDIDHKGTPSLKDDEYTPINPAATLSALSELNVEYTGPEESTAGEWADPEAGIQKEATSDADMLSQVHVLETTGTYIFRIGASDYTYQKVTVTRGYRGRDIYVTYEANDLVTFNTGSYMLRFLQPHSYHLEDGNDNLTATKIEAVYPYCNGDGSLNIYGAEMQNEQFHGGASTRPRWVWYFDSQKEDPYHVHIHSRSTISYNGISHPTYLTTDTVHFVQDTTGEYAHKPRIVTYGTLPGVASIAPTEYMVVGSVDGFKLLTTDSISDGVTKEHRQVKSFEQYWKTYNMIKLSVLGLSKNINHFDSAWVVPAGRRPALNSRLEELEESWHSFETYANATRWNGYNDKSNGAGSKVVEKLEHWFQTFDMGNGTFQIESADIPPVLVLLDLHGWEIMRRPLPTTTYPDGEEIAGLKVYDSPLVERYYFYSNATKASGCHKYSLRMQNGAERDQIKVNGVHYSSTSLGALPPRNATGVVSGGAIQDFYVTYTVKEEYDKNYHDSVTFNNVDSTYTDTVSAQPYLVLQNSRYYKAQNDERRNYLSKPIFEYTDPEGGNAYDLIIRPKNHGGKDHPDILNGDGSFIGNIFWYIKPNQNIDEEMGIPWVKATGQPTEQRAKYVLKKEYVSKGKNGFDPYNIQLQLLKKDNKDSSGQYLTIHMSSNRLEDGVMIGEYDTTMVTLEDSCTSPIEEEGYDHATMKITNQTFMAVSDVNGNMQLMPRFDHTKRLNVSKAVPYLTTLENPKDHAQASVENNASMGPQTTFFVNPKRFHYHIIDNNGREALRYKRGADFYPDITEHFKSPLAKEFTYYKGLATYTTPFETSDSATWVSAPEEYRRTLTQETMLTDAVKLLPRAGEYYYRIGTRGTFTYKKVTVTKGLLKQQITGSFAEAQVNGVECDVYVRYEYNSDADDDGYGILQGKWFTLKLADKDVQATGSLVINDDPETVVVESGTGVELYADAATPTKPATIDANATKWQWKFLAAPTDPSSDYYVEPDPYAVQLYNRAANYTDDPSVEPSPMGVPIKVPNDASGADRFALLSHSNGGYALAVAKEYDNNYRYEFLNGADMTDPDAAEKDSAIVALESTFTYNSNELSAGSKVLLGDTVVHTFTYHVINQDSLIAINATQTNEEALDHNFAPYLPESAQSPLLNLDDYKYYGFARSAGPTQKVVIEQTLLHTLAGLYDDVVYVRYDTFDIDRTPFKVPNKKRVVDSHVDRDPTSVDVSMNIEGGLPYNIVWYNDNMMKAVDVSEPADGVYDNVSYQSDQKLTGNSDFVWYFVGGDPYGLRIKHKGGKYLDGDNVLEADSASAPTFMLLRKTGYDYGILQVTGTTGANAGKKLTGYGHELTADASTDPNKFIIFGLSIHKLIYHLIIAKSCADTLNPAAGEFVDIPYRAGDENTYTESSTWQLSQTKRIFGTTQRDLTTKKNEGHLVGSMYQLGDTVRWNGEPHTYSYDAGSVSIGDELVLPNDFYRPNCNFDFYIEGVYTNSATPAENDQPFTAMNNKYKGLKLDKLMSDEQLIDQNVVVNVVYSFNVGLETNAGDGFVTGMKPAGSHYLWYTFETAESTPQLAHYTFVKGMRAEKGRALHYTNDYLWSPLGDPYGFRSFNRYIYRNNGQTTSVLTTASIADEQEVVMGNIESNGNRDIYELLPGANTETGNFRVHPLLDTDNTLFLSIDESEGANKGKLILSDATPIKEWTYGLSQDLLNPYYQGAGNIGGLTAEAKANYEEALADPDAFRMIRRLQRICYNKDSVIAYKPGYYRLFSQPGASSLSPVRYASGYLHQIENNLNGDENEADAIPMHFYSKQGIEGTFNGDKNALKTGFTVSNATQGDIPIPATEYDASTIFRFTGDDTEAKMQTQGLYVKGAQVNADSGYVKMTTSEASATTFNVMDIGGAVVNIFHADGSGRHYINYNQADASHIYDLQYFVNVPVDGSKWSMQPADTMGLTIKTNNGGDGYYYATFYAPFDVLLPPDRLGKAGKPDTTYNAYICSKWDYTVLHPKTVPATNTYAEGKFVPANTPVIIRVKDESGSLALSLPTSSPSSYDESCVFSGQHLEQLLALDADHDVYTFGVPMISDVSKDEDYDENGVINAPLPTFATSGVGFYINATPNKENDALAALWFRNNRYVQHNKVYYRATGGPASAPESKVEYVPVIFGDGEEVPKEEQQPDENQTQQRVGDGCAYDIVGRKVASEAAVKNGTWYQGLTPGIYIVDGQKIYVGY